jgi:hypothetical protein
VLLESDAGDKQSNDDDENGSQQQTANNREYSRVVAQRSSGSSSHTSLCHFAISLSRVGDFQHSHSPRAGRMIEMIHCVR